MAAIPILVLTEGATNPAIIPVLEGAGYMVVLADRVSDVKLLGAEIFKPDREVLLIALATLETSEQALERFGSLMAQYYRRELGRREE